jgi:hypothetical protein
MRYIIKITIMATEHRLGTGYTLIMLLFSEYLKAWRQVVTAIEVSRCFGWRNCIYLRQTLVNTLFCYGGNNYTYIIIVLCLFLGTKIEMAKKRNNAGKRGHRMIVAIHIVLNNVMPIRQTPE